ncbi:MAG TPA: potassium channel family protein [Pyrinomonadaceae bacterium]|jgi:voltage-gated potassium channel Kch|nr:potassium channel family protein [Pyrinomonadaceae bacterium]
MLAQLTLAFVVVSVCVLIHTGGMVVLAEWLLKRRAAAEGRAGITQLTLLLIAVFAVIVVLHLAAAAIWAFFYQQRGLFPDYETSLYFSLKSYSTVGYGDVLLPQRWRLLGCVEAITGVLLCGLSTAFIFVVLNALIQTRARAAGCQN